MAASNGVFIIHPKGPGLSDITCDFSTGATDYEVLKDSVNAHEERRLQVAYSNVAGGIARATRDLVPFEFDIVIFGASHENMLANAKALFRTLTDPHGGTVEVLYPGLDTSTLHTYYHYLQSPAPQRKSPIGATQYAITQAARAATDEMIRYGVQLTTKAWATSDPDSYVTLASGQTADNEGDSVVLNNTAIKGDAVQAVLEITGNEASGDILKDLIVCVRRMRDGANTDLEWIEAEDMSGFGGGGAPSGWDYGFFIPLRWRSPLGALNYGTDIVNNGFDTATLVTATKMQADGDDLRVYIGAVEQDRWLQDINDATTQVWVNLDFDADVAMTLDGNITAYATSFVVNEDISALPDTNIIVQIGTEYIYCSGKVDVTKTFTVEERGYGGSAVASHADTDPVYWLQHDLWIYYGNAGASAPTVDDSYKPIFELDSTNIIWTYQEFYESGADRSGAWAATLVHPTQCLRYGGNRGAYANPYEEMGLQFYGWGAVGRWRLYNPCQIASVNFTNGEKYSLTDVLDWNGYIRSSNDDSLYELEYTIPQPALANTWEAWSRNEAIDQAANPTYVSLDSYSTKVDWDVMFLEVADAAVTLDNTYTPTLAIGSEQDYSSSGSIPDSSVSGDAYISTSISNSFFTIDSGNTGGMDRTFVGKMTPIVIAWISSDSAWRLQWKSYVSSRDNPVQEGNAVDVQGAAYWRCLHSFQEMDFPPFPIPDRISEANVDNYMDQFFMDLIVTRTSGSGPILLDVTWLAKGDDWVSHVYNAVGGEGLKTSGGNIAVIDSVARSTFLRDSSDSVVQVLNQDGSSIDELVLYKQYDHRIRLMGLKDQSTLKYTATFDFLVTIRGLFLTVYPFETS